MAASKQSVLLRGFSSRPTALHRCCTTLLESCKGRRWQHTDLSGGKRQRCRPSQRVASSQAADASSLNAIFQAYARLLTQQTKQQGPAGGHLDVRGLTYQPPGAASPLLAGVDLSLPANQLGLVYGRSGAGKSTLLQVLAGLVEPSSGSIAICRDGAGGSSEPPPQGEALHGASDSGDGTQPAGLTKAQRMARVGLVFQFPERHFLRDTIVAEMIFTWPRRPEDTEERMRLFRLAEQVLRELELDHLSMDTPLSQLSDGYKRRVALAVQLVRRPQVLLLDEPLAGLDWRSRAEIASLLGRLKETECTILVVSHDLRELAAHVDRAWCMKPGGILEPSEWPLQPSQKSLAAVT